MEPFDPRDILKHRALLKINGAKAGRWIVFSVKRALEKEDGYETTVWGFRPDLDTCARQLTSPAFAAFSPALDPEGSKLAFLSERDKSGKQLHVLELHGGEATKVTDARDETLSTIECWSPDGRSLLVTANVDWKEDGEEEPNGPGRPPQVARYLPYKLDGSGITVGQRAHLYRVDAHSGQMQALTRGDFDVSGGAWSEQGERLAIVRKRGGRERHRSDLWIAQADGADARVLVDSLASISGIAWSPDGRYLALAASKREGESAMGLWFVEVENGNLERAGGEDFEIESPAIQWHPQGDRLAVIAVADGLPRLAIVAFPGRDTKVVRHGLRAIQSLAQCQGRLAFIAASMRKPEEVHSVDWNGEQERRHSAFNRSWFARRQRPHVVKRRFEVPDGDGGTEKVDAWLLRPAQGEGPFPLLVDMHGGPHSTVLIDFAAHAYWYLLLSHGWAIVAPNAVGSTGYGHDFAERLRGRWGELDLPQYEAIIRTLQEQGLADDRIACAGKSYGGFLSAWAVGHSDLFKAAAVAAPIANIESHAGTSDTGYYVTPFAMDGGITAARGRYHRLSPVEYCHRVKAATLILQGENDGRCPRGQAEELFANLIHCSEAPVELVVYPSSTHSEAESGRPSNRIDYHARVVRWLRRHVESCTA